MKCMYSHEGGAYCDKHDHGAVTVGCCGEENCPDKKMLTNYDLLISKTPEELAELFSHLCCPYSLGGNVVCNAKSKGCYECWLDWLKATADKEAGE